MFLQVGTVLTFTVHTFVLTQMLPSSSPVLSHAYFGAREDCNTQINFGEGEMHTSVSRFLTSIVAQCLLKKGA